MGGVNDDAEGEVFISIRRVRSETETSSLIGPVDDVLAADPIALQPNDVVHVYLSTDVGHHGH